MISTAFGVLFRARQRSRLVFAFGNSWYTVDSSCFARGAYWLFTAALDLAIMACSAGHLAIRATIPRIDSWDNLGDFICLIDVGGSEIDRLGRICPMVNGHRVSIGVRFRVKKGSAFTTIGEAGLFAEDRHHHCITFHGRGLRIQARRIDTITIFDTVLAGHSCNRRTRSICS